MREQFGSTLEAVAVDQAVTANLTGGDKVLQCCQASVPLPLPHCSNHCCQAVPSQGLCKPSKAFIAGAGIVDVDVRVRWSKALVRRTCIGQGAVSDHQAGATDVAMGLRVMLKSCNRQGPVVAWLHHS